jgi:putative transposase
MSYWRLYYHLIWGTKNREPFLNEQRTGIVEQSIVAVAAEFDALIHAMGYMPDHVHVAISIPPDTAVADVVQRIKGLSSFRINRTEDDSGSFKWQPEYGAITFSERSLEDVVRYVRNQPERHRNKSIVTQMETYGSPASRAEPISGS